MESAQARHFSFDVLTPLKLFVRNFHDRLSWQSWGQDGVSLVSLLLAEVRTLGFLRRTTDRSLRGLERFAGLQKLSLFYCRQVTDAGVAAVAKGCPGLQSLNLSRCKQVTAVRMKLVVRV